MKRISLPGVANARIAWMYAWHWPQVEGSVQCADAGNCSLGVATGQGNAVKPVMSKIHFLIIPLMALALGNSAVGCLFYSIRLSATVWTAQHHPARLPSC